MFPPSRFRACKFFSTTPAVAALLVSWLVFGLGGACYAEVLVLTMDNRQEEVCLEPWQESSDPLVWVRAVNPLDEDPCYPSTCSFYGLDDRIVVSDSRILFQLDQINNLHSVEIDLIETFQADSTILRLENGQELLDSTTAGRVDLDGVTLRLNAPGPGADALLISGCRAVVHEVRIYTSFLEDGFESGDTTLWQD